jgi:23S rRNA pseudouridine1911/1915/1917 synthase
LVLIAKHTAAARELGMIFERREARKEYLAIVSGWPEADAWDCEMPILRAGELGPSPIWVKQIVHEAGRECSTRFQVERRFERKEGKFSLVRCFPKTGRMHQLRVHLAHSGHPIVGDKLYSSASGEEYIEWMRTGWTPELAATLFLPRHALHAAVLEVPWGGGKVEWSTGISADLHEFTEGRELTATPGVVIWSRHD